ncbi:MAG TPA: DoxX-like family protein [Candidatus Aquabacterium excrementipullorum]|nr:DoxX-like family protein [Candidatus Aquabacterium excrementipullorum]
MALSTLQGRVLQGSLVMVWLGTAVVSAVEVHGQSLQLMRDAGVHQPGWQAAAIWGGIALDVALGLAMCVWPRRSTWIAALCAMGTMTLVATALTPDLWLHPLGPLLKNLPIAAVLWVLISDDTP